MSTKVVTKTVVLCGSMADVTRFREIKNKYPEIEFYPTEEHLKQITELIRTCDAPIPNKKRLELILEHFEWIKKSDEVWILNEVPSKEFITKEHIGIGTAIDIGYSLALNKKIKWVRRPKDPNLIALFEGQK